MAGIPDYSKSETLKMSPPDTEVQLNFDSPDESFGGGNLSGEIASAGSKTTGDKDLMDTLDEPVVTTIKRDLSAIGFKFYHVLFPRKSLTLLRDWDLWGPLFLCVFIAVMLQGSHGVESETHGPEFTEVFAITWFGACLVTLNIKLLRGSISFFQSLCVLGYCLLAPAISLIICKIIFIAATQNVMLFLIRLFITVFGFCWATFASTAFLSGYCPQRRRALAIYPIFLFYFVVSWMVVSHTSES